MPKPRVSDTVFVLDASAVLAAIHRETGGAHVEALLAQSVIGAVNLSEVVARLQDRGFPDAAVDTIFAEAGFDVIAFDTDLAIAAGRLRQITRAKGLSLGDRACIALGRRLNATVLTGDRAWADLDLGVTIELIR